MAMVSQFPASDHEMTSSSVWMVKFSAGQRQKMLADDLLAGQTVSAVLVSILAVGLAAMICTVAVPLLFQ